MNRDNASQIPYRPLFSPSPAGSLTWATTAHRLATQLDLLIQAVGNAQSSQETQELCREGRVVLDYATTVLGRDG